LNYEEMTAKNPWDFVLEDSNVIGQFIWAGMDYLGECSWPAKGWAGSVFDICGFYKPNTWLRKTLWTAEPVIYLAFYDQNIKPNYARGRWSFPAVESHLNFDNFLRRTVTAVIYTNCDETELSINGKKMGRRQPENFPRGIIEMSFEYHSGEVQVTGYRRGKAVCVYSIKTAGPPEKIMLIPDKKILAAGCIDIAHVEVNVTDANGILCPREETLIAFSLTGDGEILGACSPDLNASHGFTLPQVITSGGKALLMIKAGAGSGSLELCAYSENLQQASLKLTCS
jgi:beta-galactosidase